MKTNLPYKQPPLSALPAGSTQSSDNELTRDYVSFAVNQKYPGGLEGQLRRIWGRIQRKLDEAVESNSESVELEEAEKDFIIGAFNECKFPPHAAKYVCVLEEEINQLRVPKA